jgi:hypothetical protein
LNFGDWSPADGKSPEVPAIQGNAFVDATFALDEPSERLNQRIRPLDLETHRTTVIAGNGKKLTRAMADRRPLPLVESRNNSSSSRHRREGYAGRTETA